MEDEDKCLQELLEALESLKRSDEKTRERLNKEKAAPD